MTIIEELRGKCAWCNPCSECRDLQERAALEIEQLRAEIATLRPTGLSRVFDDYCATVQLVTQFAKGNPNLSDRVGALLLENQRLRAIVDLLPKDAEGNPVTPERELVSTHYREINLPRSVCEIRARGWRFYGSSWYEQDDENRKCYGSKEAAEAARKEQP